MSAGRVKDMALRGRQSWHIRKAVAQEFLHVPGGMPGDRRLVPLRADRLALAPREQDIFVSRYPLIWIGMLAGSVLGGFVPGLWGSGVLSLGSIACSGIGGAAGIWIGYRLTF
jgi:hypothetical protein